MTLAEEKILVIGDADRSIHAALSQTLPSAQIHTVDSYFEGLIDLSEASYTAVLAAADPIERRPEPAIRNLRESAGDARVLLFGSASYEPLSRKMLDFGLDDYLVTPVNPAELRQSLKAPALRLVTDHDVMELEHAPAAPSKIELLNGVGLAELMIDSLTHAPHDSAKAAINAINLQIGPSMKLEISPVEAAPAIAAEGHVLLCQALREETSNARQLCLTMPRDEDPTAARHFLAQLAHLLGKLSTLQDRHNRLQSLAITDDMTGLYNGRYFRVFLDKILKRARDRYFPVTLLLFDIDDFKNYNDRYGHAVGDEILKQTARLIRSCTREHDHVARIGGDEFAVIFWEKEGPRQPRDPKIPQQSGGRVPQNIVEILQRFQNAIASSDLQALGGYGRGVLSISGGLAVYPFDAHNADELYAAADKALMFGAKKSGKNSIYLISNPDDRSE